MGDLSVAQFVWGVLVVPIGWLWLRANEDRKGAERSIAALSKELNDHKLYVAQNHFAKDEVRDIVEGTIKPVRESVNRIETSLNTLISMQMQRRKGDPHE